MYFPLNQPLHSLRKTLKKQTIALLVLVGASSLTVTAQTFTVSGNVYNDTNALYGDASINGIGFNTASTQLYVNLVNGSGNVTARATVASGGTFSMTGISNGSYTLRLSTLQGTVGSAAPATTLTGNWQYTGEYLGSGSGNDGSVNGQLAITVSGANVTTAKFAAQLPPYAVSVTATFDMSKYAVAVPLNYLSSIDSFSGTVKSSKKLHCLIKAHWFSEEVQ